MKTRQEVHPSLNVHSGNKAQADENLVDFVTKAGLSVSVAHHLAKQDVDLRILQSMTKVGGD